MSQPRFYKGENPIITELLFIFAKVYNEYTQHTNKKTMLYQLPSGRTIEISVEQYLDMTDDELRELDCLSSSHTMEINNPFYGQYSKGRKPKSPDLTDEHNLTDIPEQVKRNDKYFHNNDDK